MSLCTWWMLMFSVVFDNGLEPIPNQSQLFQGQRHHSTKEAYKHRIYKSKLTVILLVNTTYLTTPNT